MCYILINVSEILTWNRNLIFKMCSSHHEITGYRKRDLEFGGKLKVQSTNYLNYSVFYFLFLFLILFEMSWSKYVHDMLFFYWNENYAPNFDRPLIQYLSLLTDIWEELSLIYIEILKNCSKNFSKPKFSLVYESCICLWWK